MKKGDFDLDDLAEQLKQMQKLGGMGGVLAMLPGIGKIKKQLDTAKLDDRILKRQQAIIGSMTRAERKNPKLLNASRKKRVAAGSGTSVQDINRLLKMHRQMADMMKIDGQEARACLAACSAAVRRPRCRPSFPPACRKAACLRFPPAAFPASPATSRVFPAGCRAASPDFPVPRNDRSTRLRRTKTCH